MTMKSNKTKRNIENNEKMKMKMKNENNDNNNNNEKWIIMWRRMIM